MRSRLNDDPEFLLERTLEIKSSDLHRRFKDSVLTLTRMLSNYQQVFPNFTDHTELHSLNVINFCNHLIGKKNVIQLNADEIYVLLMSCYFHDIGMGINEKDFESFLNNILADKDGSIYNTLNISGNKDMAQIIRKFHNEFSGMFIKKYADFFDIPSEKHVFAIAQISRGHRKTDLLNEKEYPPDLLLPNGNKICLPYLSVLIRLADEIDVASDRNSTLLYSIETINDNASEDSVIAFNTHEAIKTLIIEEDCFSLIVETEDERIKSNIKELVEKMQETLDYCRKVAMERSPFRITQEKIRIMELKDSVNVI